MRLSELKVGDKAVIVKVYGYGGFRKRLVEMGFIKGKMVEVVNKAPLGDPIEYMILNFHVSLRLSEAANIEVISVEEAERLAKENADQDYHGTITEDDIRKEALKLRKNIHVAFVGNPNCGKTSLFNALTGAHERVGNYTGVTVGAADGSFDYKGYKFSVVDLPGTYSLSAYSPEETYVRKHLVEKKPDIIVNVVDASNLERNLFLTTQLIDMNLRTVIALNMFDEMKKRGDHLRRNKLARLFGIPIVPTITPQHFGLDELLDTIIQMYEGSDIVDSDGHLASGVEDDKLLDELYHSISLPHRHMRHDKLNCADSDLENPRGLYTIVRHIHINYGSILENAISEIKTLVEKNPDAKDDFTPRYQAIKFLEKDKEMEDFFKKYENYEQLVALRDQMAERIKKDLHDTPENAIMDAKYGFIAGALKETYFPAEHKQTHTLTDKIDNIVTSPWLGYPIFLLVLYIMFESTFSLGKYPMAWIQAFIDWLANSVSHLLPTGILHDLIVDGIIQGVGGVLVFLPNILILYFFIALLDYSGYMARASFIMDKLMHKIGLHGRSFIPLMMGFGCNVPAIMAARTIENRNSRMVTILITPLMSCSARLPIYLLLAGTFFPKHAGLVVFSMYMTGIVLAALMAILFKRFLFFKKETPFVMELPPYRLPGIVSLLRDTWSKGEQYLKKIGTTILFASIIIWALSYFPRYQGMNDADAPLTGQAQLEQQENSYLGRIGKFITPVMKPLGFDWRTNIALLSGIAAKEVVISTMGVLYNNGSDSNQSLSERLKSELNPDGTHVFTTANALSLLLFVLIYIPCIATIIAIRHETGSRWWAIFAVIYTTILAWGIAFIAYQSVSLDIWQYIVVALLIIASIWATLSGVRKSLQHKTYCSGCPLNKACSKTHHPDKQCKSM